MRIGQGYDIHIFQEDRPLILGGVKLSDRNGLLGHSDADVLTHAVMDALLGAAGLRDIGTYFSDQDPQYKNISSLVLLEQVLEKIRRAGYRIGNVDTIVVAEKPKLQDHIPAMKKRLCHVMKIEENQLAIKATTKEKMDATGQGRSMEAFAICLLEELQ
ncbi:MAG: 2-C-methyl-D-erythritol 2,4-cyclodiphosphate synthase [Tissierellia bacterium]|nr:2-C-methyl-D-erythritol 2,4-cyclodiphosphate synthase [Tissierellia bacterium]